MMTVAFDGPDAAGKSPCLAVVADMLVDSGMRVHMCAPYRGDVDIYPLWATDPCAAARVVRRSIDQNLEAAAKDACDIVLFDRHWPTAAVSTTKWKAVDSIRQSAVDHLFLLVPPEPRHKVEDTDAGAWMADGVDTHWVAYRCLVEGMVGVHKPRTNRDGLFDFRRIAREVSWCCGA